MKLVGNSVNGVLFSSILPNQEAIDDIDYVQAAIAYGSTINNPKHGLIGHCVDNNLKLDIWMRYDETVPVAIPLLDFLLKNIKNNIFTNFIPDAFHSKVVWWKGYGAYIGSANHTERAWFSNIELGVFLTEDELVASGHDTELDHYFTFLEELECSIPISKEYLDEMQLHDKRNKANKIDGTPDRAHDIWKGPTFIAKKPTSDRSKQNFKKEWLSTLGILQDIGKRLDEHRPIWVEETVPIGWQVDQFLHAYYYNKLGDKNRKPYDEYFNKHRNDPNSELNTQLQWWASQDTAPSKEDITFYQSAPAIRDLLNENTILELTQSDLEIIFTNTHATKNHVLKVSAADLGEPAASSLSLAERIPLFTKLILSERNLQGNDIRELLQYVLYGGEDQGLWERLYNAGRNSDYRIPRYGLNSIAEVAGWARPEIAPPRNGRTSKALKALGFNVKIY